MNAKVIAIANRAGGVAKTASSAAIGARFAQLGFKSLLVDIDDQGDLSDHFLDIIPSKTASSMFYDGSLPIQEVWDNLSIIASNQNLAGVEKKINPNAKTLLTRALEPARAMFDFIILDCPPALNVITLNALTASDYLFVPAKADQKSLNALSRMAQVCYMSGKPTKIDGIFITMFDVRTNLAKEKEAEIRELYGDTVFNTKISQCAKVPACAAKRKNLFTYAPSSKAAVEYGCLVDEILARMGCSSNGANHSESK
jgi:chromosome partitioning protein